MKLVCDCGGTTSTRLADIVGATHMLACKACASRRVMSTPEAKARAAANIGVTYTGYRDAMRAKRKNRQPPDRALAAVARRMTWAKKRCTNKNSPDYPLYGGRGIQFQFATGADAARWVVANIGYPEPGQSIDRIDSNGHYAQGNLRWADKWTQANNKRAYRRKDKGERIRALQRAGSPFGYETLRGFIRDGMTDEQILARVKTNSGRKPTTWKYNVNRPTTF